MFIEQFKRTYKKQQNNCRLEQADELINWLQQIQHKYKHLNLKNPQDFTIVVDNELVSKKDLLFRQTYMQKMPAAQFYKLEFIYQHYDFVHNHMSKFIEPLIKRDPDETIQLIITHYIDYIMTGKTNQDWLQKIPLKGDVHHWFNWIEALGSLYYGETVVYAKTYSLLVESCYSCLRTSL